VKKRILTAFVILLALPFLIFQASPAYAYTRATGTVIDGKTKSPWAYGGEVYLVNNSVGCILGTAYLTAGGVFSITYLTTNDLGTIPLCAGLPSAGHAIGVVIDFTCTVSGDCNGLRPPGVNAPGTNTSCNYTELALPIPFSCGFIETGTGPTAVSLQSVGLSSNQATATAVMLLTLLLMAGSSLTILRRRRQGSGLVG